MSITMSNFGGNGRLCNQLWQYSAMIGFSARYGVDFVLPEWKYAKYFEAEFPKGILKNAIKIKEPEFHYTPKYFEQFDFDNINYDLTGYFQSQKYWRGCISHVKEALTFKEDFKKSIRSKYTKVFEKPTIAIHIRRGDYVGNSFYYQLPITYFILALFQIENWKEKNILVFSDDPDYARFHFGCLPNVTIIEGNSDIEDLCLGSMCNDFVLSNSSYSWWMAKMSDWNYDADFIIYPKHYFTSPKKMDDYWPLSWTEFNHEHKKIDLTDVTFMMPLTYDHKDRLENVNLNVRMICRTFECSLSICENMTEKFSHLGGNYKRTNYTHFHRTKILNNLAKEASTPIIVNWDADVFTAPLQLYLASELIRAGADLVYPYNGQFARVPRKPYYGELDKKNDVGVFAGIKFYVMDSFGGAVFYSKKSFFEAGGENENFVSWGPEDGERFVRFTKLGLKVERVEGAIYHLEHFKGTNSSSRHPFKKKNREQYRLVSEMSKEELLKHIETWNKK